MELTRSKVDETVLVCESDIKVGEIVKLVPSKSTPTGALFLSNIDLAALFPVETIYFFQLPRSDKPCTEHVVDKIKEWLSRLLVPYHFLAGRLQLNPGDGRLELNYNRSGVIFAGASSELTLLQLGDLSRPNPSFRNLIVTTDEYKGLSDAPLITMQVTRFKCGGFSVGLVIIHSIMDGQSTAEFLHNLGSIARGEGLLIEPKFDRTSLKARIPPHINHQHHEIVEAQNSMTTFTASNTQAQTLKNLPEVKSFRAFTFSPEMLQRLKQKAMKDNIIHRCSTFEVIAAHIWQARTKAVFQDPTQTSTVSFVVNIRSIINPPLPKGFVGNGVVTAYASASVHDLKKNPLSYCVAKIQKAVNSITEDYVRSRIDSLEARQVTPVAVNGNLYLSDWSKLSPYEFDLGWGKPVYAGPIVNSVTPRFVLVLSNASQQGINAWLTLGRYQMEKFEQSISKL